MATRKSTTLFGSRKSKRFLFEGTNLHSGRPVQGEISAPDQAAAEQKLKRRGINAVLIRPAKSVRKRKIRSQDIAVFTRQLSTMMKAGLPLLQAFDVAAQGSGHPNLSKLLLHIRTDIEQGSSLAQALARHPQHFDRFYCNLVAAGETGGILETLLERLALTQEKNRLLKKQIQTALIYPVSIIAVSIIIILVMMLFVLPSFQTVYADMGAELPWLTQAVMSASDLLAAYGWLPLIGLIAAAVWFRRRYRRSRNLQKRCDRYLLQLPLLGTTVAQTASARWARTTAALFAAGMPPAEALNTVAGACGNLVYEDATHAIRNQVVQGISLTTAMQNSGCFAEMMIRMAAVGEESGALDTMLDKAAEWYENEVDQTVARLSALMEPLIMVILGTLIGILLLAMYLPLFHLGDAV
ncbi:type II secretion system F family protein [Neisseria sp. ZJ106]|uniref:Type II secretion system F family protein n=1 Tax=Neisseria lisongii TaxID=2912188 RepID=A0ABY7RJ42_9NEIS|nr:type II secretion system F family protein [Neisseria lisongii]MCF7521490.1 type II secretion system F family protein [Neisseria lisongii]WCL71080.1 type II secretion system F family protein [Neisseria lisongii]